MCRIHELTFVLYSLYRYFSTKLSYFKISRLTHFGMRFARICGYAMNMPFRLARK